MVARYIICVHFGHSAHGCSKDPEVPSLYLHVYFFSPRLFATWLGTVQFARDSDLENRDTKGVLVF